MTTDSVTQIVKYQRSIGALPHGTGFLVRQHWAGPLGGMGGSVWKYVAGYKGITTYVPLLGIQDPTRVITGVLPDLLNGRNADDASQSASWNAIMTAIQTAYNAANNKGVTIVMDSFNILSPASNVPDLTAAIGVVAQLALEALQKHSVTVSGQFTLRVENLISNPFGVFDPRPVFDWSITISFDNSAESMTLTIEVNYDNPGSNILGDIVGVLTGLLAAGFDPAVGIGTGIAVGHSVDAVYNADVQSQLLRALAGPLFNVPGVVQPITLHFQRPEPAKLVASVTYQFDPTTWNELAAIISGGSTAAAALLSKVH